VCDRIEHLFLADIVAMTTAFILPHDISGTKMVATGDCSCTALVLLIRYASCAVSFDSTSLHKLDHYTLVDKIDDVPQNTRLRHGRLFTVSILPTAH